MTEIPIGKGRKVSDGSEDTAVLTFGPIGNTAAEAIREIKEETGRTFAHYDMRFAKPLDGDLLEEIARRHRRIVTIEDGVREGGFGSAVLEWMSDNNHRPDIVRLGLPDQFVEHGTPQQLYHIAGIDKEGIKQALL